MRAKIISCLFICFGCFSAKAQLNQRFDNIKYKALYFKEASKLIADDPNLLLLDVRSPGEFADTGSRQSLNIGRLKGAINISIDSIQKHLKDLGQYKDKTILVYCSHSQRSRVVSKMLTDSGFKHVNSLNGGMSLVNRSTTTEFPAMTALYTSNLPYKLIQKEDAYNFIRNKKNVVIDLRPASEFNGTDSVADNNIGRIRTAINIPADQLDGKLTGLSKFKNRPVLLYDLDNSASVKAALKLKMAGFNNINVLFEGLGTLMVNTPSVGSLRNGLFVYYPKYKIIGSEELISIVNKTPGLVIADIRPKIQFENKSDLTFMNLGHIENAVNVPSLAELDGLLKDKAKSAPILVYGSGMSGMKGMPASLNASDVCRQLAAKGYANVYLVYKGFYSVIWSVTNVESCRYGMSILTDHKGLY